MIPSDNKIITDTVEHIPQVEHLQNSPITKMSPDSGRIEAEFRDICDKLKGPVRMVPKNPIIWNKKDPLHFWQSLAFTLKSEQLPYIAVSSFVDTRGQNKLYIASNHPMTTFQQHEITDIINMFLDLKPMDEIASKLFPRHLPYIIKQFKKINLLQVESFSKEFPSQLSKQVEMIFKTSSFGYIGVLMDLIAENKKLLDAISDRSLNATEATRNIAMHLLKMIRLSKEIHFVWKRVKSHQQDKSLKSLEKQFEFISLNCHAELAIVKTAKDCCQSKTLYIGVSKRPCYCCSLFFKAVKENAGTDFQISIAETNGKLYDKWERIPNYFEMEFNQVWAKVIEDTSILEKHLRRQTDDNYSASEGLDDDNLVKMKYGKS